MTTRVYTYNSRSFPRGFHQFPGVFDISITKLIIYPGLSGMSPTHLFIILQYTLWYEHKNTWNKINYHLWKPFQKFSWRFPEFPVFQESIFQEIPRVLATLNEINKMETLLQRNCLWNQIEHFHYNMRSAVLIMIIKILPP